MQDLWSGSPLIYFFYAHTTIRRNYMVFFHYSFFSAWPFDQNLGSILIFFFFFDLYTTMWPKIMVLIDLIFFICTRPFGQKWGSSLIYFFYLHKTIRPNYMVLFHLFFPLSTSIRPKIRVRTDVFSSFVHDYLTKN